MAKQTAKKALTAPLPDQPARGRRIRGGLVINWKAASTRPPQPGVIRGFNPQPDPPGSQPKL